MFRTILVLLLFPLLQSKPDLLIGTGGFGFGCGSNSPAAQIPYSYVRLGPDTSPAIKRQYMNFQHYGGYSDADNHIRGFSHMHLVGAGVIDMGIIGVLPQKGTDNKPTIPFNQRVLFYKETEVAEPGYYNVDLQDGIKVELTTTQRAGVHRYTFNKKNIHFVNIMTGFLLDQKAPRNSTTYRCGERCLEGSIRQMGGFGGRFGGYTVHFHMKWASSGNDSLYLFNDTTIDEISQIMQSNYTGAVIKTNSSTIQLFVGISYVSRANAKLNLQTEVGSKTFNIIKKQSQAVWAKQFARFEISAVTQQHQTKLDTAIYRTMLTPTLFNDVNRQYNSFKNDGSVSLVPEDMGAIYTDMSIWDVHRTQMPWILFHDLQRFNDIAKSLIVFNRDGGYMPKWPFAQGWTGCMIGAHANTILADWIVKEAFQKKLTNISQVLSYMLRNANTQTIHDSRPNVDQYIKSGYIPFEGNQRSSCSQTLQLSFNDFGIGKVAQLLGLNDTAQNFSNRSKFYRNVWNNSTKFFDPKYANGSFVTLSKKQRINIFSNFYVEGDAWHYRFAVPHDAKGLIELFGGQKPFLKELNKFFKRSQYWPTFWLPNPYYWAGNEHDLFSVWLFSFANRSDLTAKYSRMIMKTQYGLQGNGLPGNDDYATMSAWLVFASLGFYPLPSTQTYILGSPMIHSARIYRRMEDGKLKPFNIRAERNSENNYKVESVNIDGRLLNNFITHSDMSKSNSVLTFAMKL